MEREAGLKNRPEGNAVLALKAPTCVVQMDVGGDLDIRCVFGHRHALTFKICLCTTEKGGGHHYHSIKCFLDVCPSFVSILKQH